MVLDRYNFVLKNYSDSFEFQKMNISKEQICHILQFYFDKEEHLRQATENVNRVNGCDTVPANHSFVQFHPFRSAKFDVRCTALSMKSGAVLKLKRLSIQDLW